MNMKPSNKKIKTKKKKSWLTTVSDKLVQLHTRNEKLRQKRIKKTFLDLFN